MYDSLDDFLAESPSLATFGSSKDEVLSCRRIASGSGPVMPWTTIFSYLRQKAMFSGQIAFSSATSGVRKTIPIQTGRHYAFTKLN
jgi:hypothetical protein